MSSYLFYKKFYYYPHLECAIEGILDSAFKEYNTRKSNWKLQYVYSKLLFKNQYTLVKRKKTNKAGGFKCKTNCTQRLPPTFSSLLNPWEGFLISLIDQIAFYCSRVLNTILTKYVVL